MRLLYFQLAVQAGAAMYKLVHENNRSYPLGWYSSRRSKTSDTWNITDLTNALHRWGGLWLLILPGISLILTIGLVLWAQIAGRKVDLPAARDLSVGEIVAVSQTPDVQRSGYGSDTKARKSFLERPFTFAMNCPGAYGVFQSNEVKRSYGPQSAVHFSNAKRTEEQENYPLH
ncbi:hypothetical protein G7K_6569-t1 [Saitoella complicata NRRL Y-17804]|uniref:Uncharacterized protein n=1 Tax=Saitoella complicata (strain BCRC 22490 / CBS 7301 / JCM 7358 / NBRC 10748 / NRRL Y-17804) TaxID=698492 RepID=A0A0E9NRK9_SAICN|nr:hypothetical protein G7K_6569-t1 [Saitoella complicata NRRL Y-17804]